MNVWLLHRGLIARGVLTPSDHWGVLLRRQMPLANVAMAAFLWWSAGDWSAWTGAPSLVQVGRLSICVLGGGAVYAGVLYALGLRYKDLRPV